MLSVLAAGSVRSFFAQTLLLMVALFAAMGLVAWLIVLFRRWRDRDDI